MLLKRDGGRFLMKKLSCWEIFGRKIGYLGIKMGAGVERGERGEEKRGRKGMGSFRSGMLGGIECTVGEWVV